MTRTPPQHGERRCYLRGCRRPECVAANKVYCKRYRTDRYLNGRRRVGVAPVLARLEAWINEGYSHTQIGQVTGRTSGDISKIVLGRQQTLNQAVAAQILSAPPPTGIPHHATTCAVGTVRRGQALHAIGYPIYQIAEGIPMAVNHLGRILHTPPAMVRVSLAESMTALYRRLSRTPGPSQFAWRSARRRGWLGPMAWDGNIDDPSAEPDIEAEAEPVSRIDNARLVALDIHHLAGFGVSTGEIARRVGRSESYVRSQIAGDRGPGWRQYGEAA